MQRLAIAVNYGGLFSWSMLTEETNYDKVRQALSERGHASLDELLMIEAVDGVPVVIHREVYW